MSKLKNEIQTEALAAVRPYKRAGVGVSMGVGKTLIALLHMVENYNETSMFLVVAPKVSIFESYREDIEKFHLKYLLPHIMFTTYLSLKKSTVEYDVIYLDECHNLLESHEEFLDSFSGKILGLTGTPPKYRNSIRGRLVEKFCPMKYTYLTDDAIKDKILNDYRIVVHKLTLSGEKTLKVEKGGKVWFTSELASYTYWSNRAESAQPGKEEQIMRVMRMKSLMGFPTKEKYAMKLLMDTTDKCLLFANTHDQADRLSPYSFHSKNPISKQNLADFKSGKISKLAAVLQLSEGVNIPNLRMGIIMHAYGNERKASQRIGRLLRLNPDEVATIHILCYMNTVDEWWVTNALSGFDKEKITWITPV